MTSAYGSAFVAAAVAAALLGGGSERAAAQSYPQHPITLIAATAPGGPGDTAGRVIADKMSAILGQPIIVENVSGAGGVIGATRAARATPDGETLLIHQTGITIAAAMDPNLPFNLEKDLAVVGLVNTSYSFLVARKSLPADNLRDLITWMKGPGRPAKVAHPGKGTLGYLQTLLFAKSIGAEIDAIPYRGIGPAMNDLLGEHVDLIWAGAVTASQFIKAGNIKALAYGAGKRSTLLPEVLSAPSSAIRNGTCRSGRAVRAGGDAAADHRDPQRRLAEGADGSAGEEGLCRQRRRGVPAGQAVGRGRRRLCPRPTGALEKSCPGTDITE